MTNVTLSISATYDRETIAVLPQGKHVKIDITDARDDGWYNRLSPREARKLAQLLLEVADRVDL